MTVTGFSGRKIKYANIYLAENEPFYCQRREIDEIKKNSRVIIFIGGAGNYRETLVRALTKNC